MPPAAPPIVEHRLPRPRRVSVRHALNSSTRAGIFHHLQEAAAPLTVRDVAGSFDLHPNVARTHLETLADAGLVTVGQRKHPGGGRPAKVYRARDDSDRIVEIDAVGDPVDGGAGVALLVRLLTALVDEPPLRVPPGRTAAAVRASRAHEVAAAEGRRLVDAVGGPGPGRATSLEAAASTAVRALRPHAPGARIVKAGRDWIDVAGIDEPFQLLADGRAELADALERGLLAGTLAAAGLTASIAEAGRLPAPAGESGPRVWRVRAAGVPSGARTAPDPDATVDVRGLARETGVVHAMRAVTRLAPGQVLEVLTEGPGSPAVFARWADRAGHVLLGVERAADAGGTPAIRLLIRKGA